MDQIISKSSNKSWQNQMSRKSLFDTNNDGSSNGSSMRINGWNDDWTCK